jgi:hypothetical protein
MSGRTGGIDSLRLPRKKIGVSHDHHEQQPASHPAPGNRPLASHPAPSAVVKPSQPVPVAIGTPRSASSVSNPGSKAVSSASASSSLSSSPVVTLQFALSQGRAKQVGPVVCRLQVLGAEHTLTQVAQALFDFYLQAVLNEQLMDHQWRFTPTVQTSIIATPLEIDQTRPLLCGDLVMQYPDFFRSKGLTDDAVPPRVFPMVVGTTFWFFYDEIAPTEMQVTIASIDAPAPQRLGTPPITYPRSV